ncbi:MAG TPA: BREX-2 system phosphatase PglZ [Streptosporangiaceae bacterium]|nr:BREX-2 system phosphatase PglZ [Streptosporangiaceae bacterium]
MTASASVPVLRELLDEARAKNYEHGVLGVRAKPDWPAGARTFTHDKVQVRIEPCVSALAVREALLSRRRDEWLIVLTDRSDEDLGAGLLSHFIGNRLRTPDPWAAVRHRFAATGIDPAIFAAAGDRDIATGLLAATPPDGWPPAPGGVLTRAHAFGAVAAAHLGLSDPVIDIAAVLAWAAGPALPERVFDLRALAGDPLTDAVLAWAAERTGAIAPAVRHLLRGGEARDVIPLGLAAGVLAGAGDSREPVDAQVARDALIRMETRLGGAVLPPAALTSWAGEASAVVTGMLRDTARRAAGEALLARADHLLEAVRAAGLAGSSDLLPSGLTRRFAALAAELRAAAGSHAEGDPDRAIVTRDALGRVEQAWASVAAHHLAGDDRRTRAFHAAVRLTRWLAGPAPDAAGLPALLRRHADQDAWADLAVNAAAAGVGDPELGAGLAAVLDAVRARRAAHDAGFAAALAAYTRDDRDDQDVLCVERVLPDVVMPLARQAPVLLLVLDGMSAGVGAEVAASILGRPRDGWAEALVNGQSRRAAAIAVLPTLTEVSRASLLSGELRRGGQDAERDGYAALARAHGLPDAPLFHKGPLDSARPGYAIADEVAAAIADVTRYPLVTCVLNSVDDALDRSDPGGISWGADTVKHLDPLLERARHAGRTVILTADHGHVIERRQGIQRPHPDASSTRSRGAGTPPGDGEVAVTGRRVLLHGGTAVLAVEETLRYGPVKSGYHGGVSPAEVVVPVTVLVPGAVPADSGLRLAPPQEPPWWTDPVLPAAAPGTVTAARPAAPAAAAAPAADRGRKQAGETAIALFDVPEPRAAARPESPVSPAAAAAAVLASAAYKANKRRAGRVSVGDAQVGALLTALAASPSRRLAPVAAAAALEVSTVLLRGAVMQAQQLLNIDGAAVIRVDADGATVILDDAALQEQYGIRL